MPLGQGIGELWNAVRDRVEVSGEDSTWQVTAGSFESALAYARERFGDPVVLARKDRDRWWPRVTLTVTTDPELAASAPPLEDVAHPVVPAQVPRNVDATGRKPKRRVDPLPPSLEAIFAHQEEQRMTRQRIPAQSSPVETQDSRGLTQV
jgi:hypothetical protein